MDGSPTVGDGHIRPDGGDGEGGQDDSDGGTERCDYCRLPVPDAELTAELEGIIYSFCSRACREALVEHDRVFTEYHGFRRVKTGVSALDSALPRGVPRNSFVLLSGHAGTREEALTTELVWRTLQRGESAVLMAFIEPPVSVIQQFARLEWNVLPYLESGQLEIIDCFTYRLEDRDRMYERMNDWNRHLHDIAAGATTTVQDPSDVRALENHLDRCVSDHGMQDSGVVVIDSLTELGTLVQPGQGYDFLKNVRADVCKSRFVPIFANATISEGREGFPHDLDYMVDGVVEMQFNEELVEQGMLKQIRARKMSGVLTVPQWTVYEYTRGIGLIPLTRGDDEEDGGADDGDGGAMADDDTDDGADSEGSEG